VPLLMRFFQRVVYATVQAQGVFEQGCFSRTRIQPEGDLALDVLHVLQYIRKHYTTSIFAPFTPIQAPGRMIVG